MAKKQLPEDGNVATVCQRSRPQQAALFSYRLLLWQKAHANLVGAWAGVDDPAGFLKEGSRPMLCSRR